MKKSPKARNCRQEPLNPLEREIAITELHNTGEFTILRKLNLSGDPRFTRRSVPGALIGLCLDTETTGLSHGEDRVIELGMVAFEYDPLSGEIITISERYNGFEDPGRPLAPEITEITGISDEMLAGQRFDDGLVEAIARKAALVIAHNAAFDRKFVEARFPFFARLPWACTVSQLDWQKERLSSRSLEYLLYKCGGYYINAHRALDDAEGVLGLLLGEFPSSGGSVFRALLTRAMEVTSRITAVGAPFERKDQLKQRGYRWNDGAGGGSKGWWLELPREEEQAELKFLADEIYPGGRTGSVAVSHIDPLARFSLREGEGAADSGSRG